MSSSVFNVHKDSHFKMMARSVIYALSPTTFETSSVFNANQTATNANHLASVKDVALVSN
jgi:hypothetical protein